MTNKLVSCEIWFNEIKQVMNSPNDCREENS